MYKISVKTDQETRKENTPGPRVPTDSMLCSEPRFTVRITSILKLITECDDRHIKPYSLYSTIVDQQTTMFKL